jgi:N-acetylmuramoyl-L-alanine amidase
MPESHYTVVMRFGFVPLLMIAAISLLLASPLLAQANGVGTPRLAAHPDEGFTRIVMDAPSKPKWLLNVNGRTLILHLKPATATEVSGSSDTPEVAAWKLEADAGSANLILKTTFDLGVNKGYRVFALDPDADNPYRVVVDIGAKLGVEAKLTSTVNLTSKLLARSKPVARPPKRQYTVVLDPGHGGIDPGAVGYSIEKRVTLNVGLKVRAILQAAGVNVVMTRTGDYAMQKTPSILEKRKDLSWRANMASTDRNLFVSIHVNAGESSAQGIETYVFGEPLEGSTLAQAERENGGGSIGRELTRQTRNAARDLINDQLVQENLKFSRILAKDVQAGLLARTGARSRGVHPNSLWVIRFARIPAILTEIGFGTHPTEGRNLGTGWYSQKVAQGIANGILKFLHLK